MSTQFLEQAAGRIAYEDVGSGPLVVCAPSIGDLRAEYRFLTPYLVSAGYRVVSMDLRGHGESSAFRSDYSMASMGRDLLALTQSLEAGPAMLVGTSMAAGAGIWAAVEEPQAVSGLVMFGPAVRGEVGEVMRLLLKLLFARPWGPAAWKIYYTHLYPTYKPQDFEAYTQTLSRNLREPGRMEALMQMMLEPKTDSEVRVSQARVPSLVIMGRKDPDFKDPEAEARWLANSLGAPYEMIAGAGHYPHAEMPETAAGLVIAFLQNLEEKKVSSYVA